MGVNRGRAWRAPPTGMVGPSDKGKGHEENKQSSMEDESSKRKQGTNDDKWPIVGG